MIFLKFLGNGYVVYLQVIFGGIRYKSLRIIVWFSIDVLLLVDFFCQFYFKGNWFVVEGLRNNIQRRMFLLIGFIRKELENNMIIFIIWKRLFKFVFLIY